MENVHSHLVYLEGDNQAIKRTALVYIEMINQLFVEKFFPCGFSVHKYIDSKGFPCFLISFLSEDKSAGERLIKRWNDAMKKSTDNPSTSEFSDGDWWSMLARDIIIKKPLYNNDDIPF